MGQYQGWGSVQICTLNRDMHLLAALRGICDAPMPVSCGNPLRDFLFIRAHATLMKAAKGYNTTPGMACGLTDYVWTVEEMLSKMEMDYAIAA